MGRGLQRKRGVCRAGCPSTRRNAGTGRCRKASGWVRESKREEKVSKTKKKKETRSGRRIEVVVVVVVVVAVAVAVVELVGKGVRRRKKEEKNRSRWERGSEGRWWACDVFLLTWTLLFVFPPPQLKTGGVLLTGMRPPVVPCRRRAMDGMDVCVCGWVCSGGFLCVYRAGGRWDHTTSPGLRDPAREEQGSKAVPCRLCVVLA
ncbi:uncharacterized protein LY79DRAFT_200529 [Colletotrichum navitas]|uniref:Uncharacterized protein n=1 Tax=Colletotrichum navitas TaxID=681940 RepID=A0AAD8V5W4_9PEZI|nr:uncharacterized protein LY79DRAFT_200529 [Colletotrichum navitas]KAK1590794.1 hypothetical protein LY79DRAFT_200529 [Colletotrichum navitas]